jgi:hypothetical protein
VLVATHSEDSNRPIIGVFALPFSVAWWLICLSIWYVHGSNWAGSPAWFSHAFVAFQVWSVVFGLLSLLPSDLPYKRAALAALDLLAHIALAIALATLTYFSRSSYFVCACVFLALVVSKRSDWNVDLHPNGSLLANALAWGSFQHVDHFTGSFPMIVMILYTIRRVSWRINQATRWTQSRLAGT